MQKRKVIIYTSILILLFQGFFGVYWLTNEQKWAILENFKKMQYDLLFDNDGIIFDEEDRDILSSTSKINMYNSVSSKIKSKREYLEQQNDSLIKRIGSLENAISELDTEIEELVNQANQTNTDIIFTKDQIDKQQLMIDVLSKKVEQNRKILLDYLIHLYKKWNYVYDGKTIDNLKAIILSWENIGDLINDMYFKWVIEITGKKLIDQHRDYISELYIKKIDLQKQEASLKALRKALMLEKKLLDDKKSLKERILEASKWQESLYQKYIAEKIELERNLKLKELQETIKFNNTKKKILDKYDCDFIDLGQDTIFSRNLSWKCLELNKIIYAESKLKTFSDTERNILEWPVLPYYGISAYYKDSGYKEEFWSTHDAIDIVVPQGTSVKAAADGYVVYMRRPTTNDYAFLAIKHADGYVTVYGHVNEILVDENDIVEKWQVIAKSWWEYGTNGAWLMTTGPHLHFELFKDKETNDPLEFLDVSYLPYDDIPDKYKYKFTQDFKDRKWYEYTNAKKTTWWKRVFSVEGETEIERQRSFLSKYAHPSFSDWNMWVEEAIDWSIDPTFLMCIWLAETWLWWNMKTPFNVWNIGNTDSWATRTMQNARQWVYLMVATLNNRYLGKYTKMEQLSRYWNKDGSIYASSPDHWHNNIVKCLTHIKQEYIPDDYNFRLQ